ncbi:MAG: ATP-grasp fold amidoligase family protein [Pontixanthobacter sp.]
MPLSDRLKTSVRKAYGLGTSLLPMKARVLLTFFKAHGYLPNTEDPKTFAEKIHVRKSLSGDFYRLVDKISVKQFVEQRCGSDIVIPTLYSGTELPPLSERNEWPFPYIIKTNHASGTYIIVRDTPDWSAIETKLERFTQANLGELSGELFYEKIEPKILVEPMIGNGIDLPLDYKFFVFGEQIAFIQVDLNREHGHRRNFYSTDWKRLDIQLTKDNGEDVERPKNFLRMIAIALELGRSLSFARIDLYNVDGKIYFGEITFTPNAGFSRFTPPSLDRALGDKWILPDKAAMFTYD